MKVHVPPVGLFNVAKELKNHMECTSKLGSWLWWKWLNGQFAAQCMGKSHIMKITKKIARFLEKDPEEYAFHSFCHSRATSMVEGGATTNQLLVSGGWSNEGIVCGYIEQSTFTSIDVWWFHNTNKPKKQNRCNGQCGQFMEFCWKCWGTTSKKLKIFY